MIETNIDAILDVAYFANKGDLEKAASSAAERLLESLMQCKKYSFGDEVLRQLKERL